MSKDEIKDLQQIKLFSLLAPVVLSDVSDFRWGWVGLCVSYHMPISIFFTLYLFREFRAMTRLKRLACRAVPKFGHARILPKCYSSSIIFFTLFTYSLQTVIAGKPTPCLYYLTQQFQERKYFQERIELNSIWKMCLFTFLQGLY